MFFVRSLPFFLYGALAFLVIAPWLRPGDIFLLDWTTPIVAERPGLFFPHLGVWFFYIFHSGFGLPLWLLEKVYFAGILFLGAYGMHRFVRFSLPAKLFAGFFYGWNAFVYARFFFGQMNFLLAYALLPFLVSAFVDFLEHPRWRSGGRLLVWSALVLGASIHIFPLVVLLVGMLSCSFFCMRQNRHMVMAHGKKYLGRYLIVLCAVIFLVWAGAIVRYGRVEQTLAHITWNDFIEFGTEVPSYGNLGSSISTIFSLHGFWGERDFRYLLPRNVVPGWTVWHLLLLALCFVPIFIFLRRCLRCLRFGSIKTSKEPSPIARIWLVGAFFFLMLVSTILALGIGHPASGRMTYWLFTHIPFYEGLRDTQKWQALLALSLAYVGSAGIEIIFPFFQRHPPNDAMVLAVESVGRRIPPHRAVTTGTTPLCGGGLHFFRFFLVFLPFFLMPLMFFGFGGQISASVYPKGWYAARDILVKDESSYRVLFLPWHRYLPLSFTEYRVVGNPAGVFFGKKVIAGDNIEKGSIYTTSLRPESKEIEWAIVREQIPHGDVAFFLDGMGVKYVILALEYDFSQYLWLIQEESFEAVYQDDQVAVFLNREFSGKNS